ncbi:hypothetical protein BN871_EE_00040 [Paenibacillus sp. P22]|nr:hypothetical protein BN871_EE_00040 [Paenibacillus sp. P22]
MITFLLLFPLPFQLSFPFNFLSLSPSAFPFSLRFSCLELQTFAHREISGIAAEHGQL